MMTKAFSTFKDERKTKDDKVSMLERLALSTSQEEFEKALIKGSDLQRFFSLLQDINKATPEDFTKEWPSIREFCKDIDKTGQGKVLRYEVLFKYLLHRIPATEDLKERKKLMLELNSSFLQERFKTIPVPELKPIEGEEKASMRVVPSIGSEDQLKDFLEKQVYTSDEEKQRELGISNFAHAVYSQLDMLKVVKVNQDLFTSAIRALPSYTSITNIAEALNEYTVSMRKKNGKFTLDTSFFKKCTLEQLVKLTGIDSFDFLRQVLVKQFNNDEALKTGSPADRARLYSQALETLRTKVSKSSNRECFESYLSLLRLIELTKAEAVDLPALDSYLANTPVVVCQFVEPKSVQTSKISISGMKVFESVSTPTSEDFDAVIKFYIKKSLTEKEVEPVLKKYLRREPMEKEAMIQAMLSGRKLDQIRFMTEIELNHIRDRCEISIKEVKEDGTITACLKNIPNLILTVYEINTVNYYKTKKNSFDSQLDVAGIIPTETFKFSYSQPSMEVHNEIFEVSRIKSTDRGLFIVELTGQGLNSRAIVKRGGLNLVQTMSPTANRYCILDENKQICLGESAKIWMADKEYLANAEGWIEIPFQASPLNQFAMIQVNNYAEPYKIDLPAIQLSLKTSVIFNEECLVGGNRCDFLINPKILAQHGQVDKNGVSEYSVTILSVNSDGVKHAQVFEDCELNDAGCLEINYHVPKKTNLIIVTTNCKVNDQKLSSVLRLTTKEVGTRGQTFDITLHKEASRYLAKISGINGEPIRNTEIRVTPTYIHNNKKETHRVETDSKGLVDLGSLLCVKNVRINCDYRDTSAERSFDLGNSLESRFLSIPDRLDAVEGEDIMLPALKAEVDKIEYLLSAQPYIFEKVSPQFDTVIEDYRKNIELQGGVLFLTKLSAGHYRFIYQLSSSFRTIHITVSKGERWQRSNEYIITGSTIRRLQNQTNYLTFDELKTDQNEASLRVYSNLADSAKVTLLAYYSLPPNFELIKQSAENLRLTEQCSEFPISGNSQMHMSNKEISDEQKYIISRNQLTEDQYGSTLPRPSGLLHQQFNRATKADGQKTTVPKQYTSVVGNVGSMRSVQQPNSRVNNVTLPNELNLGIPSIREKGRLVGVKSVDADSRVSFDLSSLPAHLNILVALVEDENNFTYKIFERQPSADLAADLKDVRLPKSMEPGKVHYYKRDTKAIRNGETVDTGDCQFALIESVDQLFELQRSTFGGTLEDWQFIKRWPSLDRTEQLEKYNNFASHELNFFLYCKDRAFFEEVVKPFLQNKAKKDIVDYFLLGDKEQVKYMTRISLLASYTPWELAMAYSLTKDEAISTYLLGLADPKADNYKAMFDSVLAFYQHEESDSSHKSIATLSGKVMGGEARYMDTRCDEQPRGQMMMGMKMSKQGGKRHGGLKMETEEGYTAVGSTFEFKETYYMDPSARTNQPCLAFWKEVMTQMKQGFEINNILSEKFVLSSGGLAESIMTLAVLGLSHGNRGNSKLLLTKTLSIGNEESDEKESVLVSQVIFEKKNSFEVVKGRQRIKQVRNFVTGVVYTTKLTATNTTEAAIDCELTLEIPEGSIPLNGDNFYTTKSFHLNPFETSSFTQDFYFPEGGEYNMYPATASQEGKLMRHASSFKLKVEPQAAKSSEPSLAELVSNLAFDQVAAKLRQSHDLAAFSNQLAEVEPLLGHPDGYSSILNVCREKSFYAGWVWKYSLLQGDIVGLREYMEQRFIPCGEAVSLRDFTLYFLESPLLKLDAYVAKEYDPLVNPKVHLQGNFKHNIANTDFLDTYMHFLKYYVDKSPTHVKHADKLLFVSYLVAQERQAEALELMAGMKNDCELGLQTAYLRVYALATQASDAQTLAEAQEIAAKHLNCPVLAWQRRFAAVSRLLSEVAGTVSESSISPGETNVFEANSTKASSQPSLQIASHDGQLSLSTRHLDEVSLQFFVVDIETKFSLNPFDSAQTSSSGLVRAAFETIVKIEGNEESDGHRRQLLEIPQTLASQNLLVQVSGRGITATVDHLPSTVSIALSKDELEITAKGQRLPSCYIKIYARTHAGGPVVLFKDGYTNILGRFNYANVCLETIDRFSDISILALDKNNGASILRLTREDRQKAKMTQKIDDCANLTADISEALKTKKGKYQVA